MPQDKKKIFLECWKARKWLRIHGFLPDSENKKITKRLEKYVTDNQLCVTDKELNS